MRTRIYSILLILAALGTAYAAGADLALRLIRDGNHRFHIEAEVLAAAPEAIVLETVRDYDHMTGFIPMLIVSRRTDFLGRPAVEQVGRARFFIFHFDAKAILEEKFDPAARTLDIRAVEGDFKRFDSFWEFQPVSPKTTRIALRSEADLKRWLPEWLERRQVRKAVDESLRALVVEMERRARLGELASR